MSVKKKDCYKTVLWNILLRLHECTHVCIRVCKHIQVPKHELTGKHHFSHELFPSWFVVYMPLVNVPCRKSCYLLIPKNFPKACHFFFFLAYVLVFFCNVYGFCFHRGLYLALKCHALFFFFTPKLAILLLLYERMWLTMSHADTET